MGEGPRAEEKRPGIHYSGSTQNPGTQFLVNYFVKHSVNEYVIITCVHFCFCNDGCDKQV